MVESCHEIVFEMAVSMEFQVGTATNVENNSVITYTGDGASG